MGRTPHLSLLTGVVSRPTYTFDLTARNALMPFASPSSAVVTRAVDILAAAGVRNLPMPNVTYFVMVPFTRDDDGMVMPGEAKEAPNGEAARRRAAAVATVAGKVGAIAFSRTGDPDIGARKLDQIAAVSPCQACPSC